MLKKLIRWRGIIRVREIKNVPIVNKELLRELRLGQGLPQLFPSLVRWLMMVEMAGV